MGFTLRDLMAQSGVSFGTSGARGLASDMTDAVCHAYTTGFLQYLRARGWMPRTGGRVGVGGDLRPSTGRIMAAAMTAVADAGAVPVHCGRLPSPALALYGIEQGIPTLMVTGSHIPDDRNGIKFNRPDGEILKSDEAGIAEQVVQPCRRFEASGAFEDGALAVPAVETAPLRSYLARYLQAFPGSPLAGMRVGVYQHSAVGRDVLVEVLQGLGAETVALGRSERFIPVDTEAIRAEDVELARGWAAEQRFDALVSADGDSDRPLVADEQGDWLRGDVAGVLCARFLDADSVSTPVSSNTVVERCGWFPEVRRTRIGSPYVIASMGEAAAAGRRRVVGYEANGGFLIQTDLDLQGRMLRALPTRDALIVVIGVLMGARGADQSVRGWAATLPRRFTASDRLKSFPVASSRAVLGRYQDAAGGVDGARLGEDFGGVTGSVVASVDGTDGVRATFANGEIVHLRPSGNAPEFRCYTEADTAGRATRLCAAALDRVAALAREG